MTNGRETSGSAVRLAIRTLFILASSILLRFSESEAAPISSQTGLTCEYLPLTNVPRIRPEDPSLVRTGGRTKRYSLLGTSRKVLTYRISKYSEKLNRTALDAVMAKAFALWSEHTDLTFTPKTNEELVDIDVRFVRGEHGDEVPFDGPGGLLAHTFYRHSSVASRSGQIDFDDDENWTISSSHGVDFFQIALHEVGHILGLGHSDVETAAMYPAYSPNRVVKLDRDDIEGIKALFPRDSESEDSDTGRNSSEWPAKTSHNPFVDIFNRLFFFSMVTSAYL